MAISLKNQHVTKLVKALSKLTGESMTEAIKVALEERLLRENGRRSVTSVADELRKISKRCAALPVIDSRTPDEILGYSKSGSLD